MGFSISKSEFTHLLGRTYPIVPMKSTLQILSNLKIRLEAGQLEVSATDLDHSIMALARVDSHDSFEIAVNARKLFDIVRELPQGSVEVEIEDNVMVIKSERGFSCRIAGSRTDDFPGFPEVEKIADFEIEVASLAALVAKSGFAVSKDESRACLCGIYWEIGPERTGMVATDGHRLGSSFIPCNLDVGEGVPSPIVSPKSMQHLVRMVGNDHSAATLQVVLGEKYIVFSNEYMKMCSKLIDGPYPDYKKVIPLQNPKKAVLERSRLVEALKRVSVLSNQKTNLVRFSFAQGVVELLVLNQDIGGEAREQIDVEYEGEPHDIGFNAGYMNEICTIISSQKVRLEMNTQISACLIFPQPDDDTPQLSEDLFLIMPLRIMDDQ